MDAIMLIKKLAQSAFVQSEVSMQMQLGLPWLKKQGERLLICFRPHIEEYRNGNLEIYGHQYEVAWVYPFVHLAYFRNLAVEGYASRQILYTIPGDKLLEYNQYLMRDIYADCTRMLDYMEQDGQVSDLMVRKYQQSFLEKVDRLGLSALYQDI